MSHYARKPSPGASRHTTSPPITPRTGTVPDGDAPPRPGYNLAGAFRFASPYQGTPYLRGGDSPNGFDDSGFVRYILGEFGATVPHSVMGIRRSGTPIDPDHAVIGDIVVWNSGVVNTPDFVGFYAGRNHSGILILQAHPGAGVAIHQIYPLQHFEIIRIGVQRPVAV